MTTRPPSSSPLKGRAARSNDVSRFDAWTRERVADESQAFDEPETPQIQTIVFTEKAKRIISRNQSPDLPFDASINPYRGCEHGCIYCYARPSHAYLGLSPGLDFETRLYAKDNAAALLEAELAHRNYVPTVIALGANTDPYQPIERDLKITRGILEVLERFNHPVAITTKSGVVTRDIDILQRMAAKNLVRVHMSVTSLKNEIARTLEPRASAPARRLAAIAALSEAGIPVGVMVAPVIPSLTDPEMESILEAAAKAGAKTAAYILLRLPREVEQLFSEWLATYHPLRARHVESLVAQMRGGQAYDSRFGTRMTGTGIFAELLRKRFKLACQRFGLNAERHPLTTEHFSRASAAPQMSLF
ncbi:PA0069 family radical SAM protein [Cupriavidus sp. D39]|uniref:PA0069 family radical SAM protein n=1 Tax=Cupriavidus sp. D39 TaxID=2997877 RepID=UPI00226E9FC5|nr:PA0069 family radical SAM protein [Cupriavidus sp. D39]MCY0858124.1 PA0069 family radical SAM protein [Cupriavidus sp. D39]